MCRFMIVLWSRPFLKAHYSITQSQSPSYYAPKYRRTSHTCKFYPLRRSAQLLGN